MIDKMYLMFPTYNLENGKLIYESYNNELNESEQTKGALQNRLIELYKAVLLNENVIGEVMTPVDFDHFKKDIRSIVKEKPTTNLSTFNQLDDIDTRYSFLAGKSLVGQEANALMDYVLGSLANANGNNFKITNFNVPKSNEKLDMEYSQKLFNDDLKYYAKQLKLNDDQVKKLQSIKISHSLSAILNAAVDIAKDPYVTDGNWGTMTTNTGNLLLRKGVHPFYVNALLAQPVIKEYVEFAASYEASENQGKSTADAFIEIKFGKEDYNELSDSNIFNRSLQTLRSKEFSKDTLSQMNVFNTFLKYQAASKAIKANIDASKFMVDGVGGSVMSLIMAKNRVDAILEAERRYYELEDKSKFTDNIILGFRSKFTNPDGSESMFSKYYTNIILKPLEIVKGNPKLFLVANETIQNTFNEISIDAKNELLIDSTLGEANLGKQLDKAFYSYIMSGFDALSITSQERRDLTLKFPKEFEAFKEANKDKYTIIDEITVNQGNTLEFIGLNNRKKSQAYEDLMVGSFLDLLNKDEEFADKLIKYSYLVSGFANNKSQFFSMIPTQWFNRNNINRYIIDKSSEYNNDYKGSNDDNFINQYYLANLEVKKLVKNVSQGQILKGSFSFQGFVLDKPGKAGYFRVMSDPNGQNPDIYYRLIGYDEEYRGVYSRFIPNINDELSEIKLLNVKDKKGNRIINYDTKGINLKPVTETSSSLAKNIDKTVLSKLHNSAIYPRDKFYRENVIIKKDEVVMVSKDMLKSNIIHNVSPDYGVLQVNTKPSENKTNEFVNLIKNQIEKQLYKENIGKFANQMFHFGLMWARVKQIAQPLKIKSFAPTNKRDTIIDSGKDATDYTYAYHLKDQNGNDLPSLSELQPIIDEIQNSLGMDMSDYDSLIGNVYFDDEFIYPHKDVTESKSAEKYPVIVYTIGNNAGLGIVDNNDGKMTFANQYDSKYLFGNDALKGYTNEVLTENGSIYTFGNEGKGRFQLTHSTPIQNKKLNDYPSITLPNGKVVTKYTITLTFRRAQDLTDNISKSPKKLEVVNVDEVVTKSKKIDSEQSVIPLTENFTRNSVEKDSDYLYLFTDNAKRSSGNNSLDYNSPYSLKYTKSEPLNYPTITQAVIRGLNNAFPITTMVDDKRTQWTDDRFEEYKNIIDDEITTIQKSLSNYKGIKFAAQMQFGKGKISNMKESAPKIFEYMTAKLAEIGIDNTGNKPTVIETKSKEVATVAKSEVVEDMNELINYSGSQLDGSVTKGGDKTWFDIGKEFNVVNHIFYSPQSYKNLPENEKSELNSQYTKVVRFLGRGVLNESTVAGQLVRRDMMQANSANGIFGVTTLIASGNTDRSGRYPNKKPYITPDGGTGYALARGILENKPTFVFNQSDSQGVEQGWYKWSVKDNNFVKTETPILTKNYAGIGTREINELGIQAIKDVYEKTKSSLSKIKDSNKPQQLSLFEDLPGTLDDIPPTSNC